MATLAVDTPRVYELGDIGEHPVIAADIIYEGAAVGLEAASGNARPLVAGDKFLGFAEQNVDNSLGSAGEKRVRVIERGKIEVPIAGLAATNVGDPVYASDDNTFTLSDGAGANSFIGRVARFVEAGVGVVAFDATRVVAA
ncbi:MAG TPA: hypothetical protein VF188_09185 [Longimicrobiales bacterium]